MHDERPRRFDIAGPDPRRGRGLAPPARSATASSRRRASQIFEAPRYFEPLVVGRTPDEVLDIVARICGICPVAYQMTAVHAFEDLFGVEVDPATRALRRLLYCGEWIESHALHVYLLHAARLPRLPERASSWPRTIAQRSRTGLAPQADRQPARSPLLGGRAIHPVSRPRRRLLAGVRARRSSTALAPALHEAARASPRDGRLSRRSRRRRASSASRGSSRCAIPDEYPMNEGRIVSNDGLDLAPEATGATAFHEEQVRGRTRSRRGRPTAVAYLLGPAARIACSSDGLHPLAREALDASGALSRSGATRTGASSPGRSSSSHATAEAHRHRRRLSPAGGARRAVEAAAAASRPGPPRHRGASSSTATRSTSAGRSRPPRSSRRRARTRPPSRPTSRRSRRRSSTCRTPRPRTRLEQLIRSYDPCISCATHFLDLSIERG